MGAGAAARNDGGVPREKADMHTTTASARPRPAGSEQHPAGRGIPRRRIRRAARPAIALAAATAAAMSLTGCVALTFTTTGGSTVVEETREVSEAVHAVHLDTSGELEITLGDEPGLVITAPDTVMSQITVREVGGVLEIDRKNALIGSGLAGQVRFELVVTSLDELEVDGSADVVADFSAAESARIVLDGSGDITATGLDVATATIRIDGSGGTVVDGTADRVVIELDGSGHIDADRLVAATADVELGGSGDIAVRATDSADVRLQGSGTTRVGGHPRLSQQTGGSGDIITVD